MKLFHWESEALRGYAAGDIIVMSDNIENAKKAVLEKALTYYVERSFCTCTDLENLLDFEEEMVEEFLTTLKEDLTKDPKISDIDSVVFIRGSE